MDRESNEGNAQAEFCVKKKIKDGRFIGRLHEGESMKRGVTLELKVRPVHVMKVIQ